MIKKRKPKKVLILGSGALQIGQAVSLIIQARKQLKH